MTDTIQYIGEDTERLRAYLRNAVVAWRKVKERERSKKKKERATHYVDAYQSVHKSVFGELVCPNVDYVRIPEPGESL